MRSGGVRRWLCHLSAPCFLATKFEAFRDRGHNDVYLSHDLEDILTVVEGRALVVQELAEAPAALRRYVHACVRDLLTMSSFHNALPGLLSDPDQEAMVMTRLNQVVMLPV